MGGLVEVEAEMFSAKPGDRAGIAVESGLGNDGVVRPAVERDEKFIAPDGEGAAGFDELAIELFGLHRGAAVEALGEPTVAAIGQDGQADVGVDVEADFAGQAVEVEGVDVDGRVVFDGITAEVAGDDVAATETISLLVRKSVGVGRPSWTATWRQGAP